MRLVASLRVLCAVCVLGAALTASAPAAAQARPLKWDADLAAGVSQRFTTGGSPGSPTPDLGPLVQAEAHVALLPMIRVGLYAAEDLSPRPGRLRSFTAGGLHARLSPPLLPIPWHTWVYAGFGFAAAFDGGAGGTAGSHASGQLFDAPVGLGLGAKLGRHWMLFTELGARLGFGFYGPMYRAAPAETGVPYQGHDSVALALTVGLSWEE